MRRDCAWSGRFGRARANCNRLMPSARSRLCILVSCSCSLIHSCWAPRLVTSGSRCGSCGGAFVGTKRATRQVELPAQEGRRAAVNRRDLPRAHVRRKCGTVQRARVCVLTAAPNNTRAAGALRAAPPLRNAAAQAKRDGQHAHTLCGVQRVRARAHCGAPSRGAVTWARSRAAPPIAARAPLCASPACDSGRRRRPVSVGARHAVGGALCAHNAHAGVSTVTAPPSQTVSYMICFNTRQGSPQLKQRRRVGGQPSRPRATAQQHTYTRSGGHTKGRREKLLRQTQQQAHKCASLWRARTFGRPHLVGRGGRGPWHWWRTRHIIVEQLADGHARTLLPHRRRRVLDWRQQLAEIHLGICAGVRRQRSFRARFHALRVRAPVLAFPANAARVAQQRIICAHFVVSVQGVTPYSRRAGGGGAYSLLFGP